MRKKFAALLTAVAFIVFEQTAQAGQVATGAQGIIIPQLIISSPLVEDASGSAGSMTASGDALYVNCYIWSSDPLFQNGTNTLSIDHINFPTQTVTCTGGTCGTTLRVSVQTPSVVNAAPPSQPDGAIRQGGLAFGTALLSGVTQNTWVTGPTFATAAVVDNLHMYSFVIDYSVFGTSGVFNLRANTGGPLGVMNFGPLIGRLSGGTYTVSANAPIPPIEIVYTNGTRGGCRQAGPYSATAQLDTYNSGSNPNSIAMGINLGFSTNIIGLCASGQVANNAADAELDLRDNAASPALLGQVLRPGHGAQATGNINGNGCSPITPVAYTKGTTLNLEYLATTANNIGMQSTLFGGSTSLDSSLGADSNFCYKTRHNGAFSACTNTLRPNMAIVIDGFGDGQ